MKLTITTTVAADYRTVFSGFNRELFIALSPPFPRVTLLKFGMQKGDEVALRIGAGPVGFRWVSKITDSYETADEIGFVDEGSELPLTLQRWRHRHRIVRRPKGALIIDEIEYEARPRILSGLLYPFLWLQFIYRKPIYRRFFGVPQP
jgi:ligand-binding SRPBCC domain-containing protein